MTTSGIKCSLSAAASKFAGIVHRDSGSIFRSRLIFFAKCTVALSALGLLFKTIGFQPMAVSLKNADPVLIMTALLLLVPNLAVQILKWRFMLGWTGITVSWSSAAKSIIAAYPLGFVTPGRLGEISRAFWITQIRRRDTLRLAILDKLSNMAITLLAGGLSIIWFVRESNRLSLLLAGGLALLFAILLGSVFSTFFRKWLSAIGGVPAIRRKQAAVAYTLSFLFYAVFTLQFVLLVHAFQPGAFDTSICAAGAVFFTKTLLPISLSDLGIREGAAVFFFERIGISPVAAVNAALLLFFMNVCLPTIAGTIILLKSKFHVEATHTIPQPG